ncbi:copper homeostasis protein CutC [Winogradskyella haliclonae]|uniref:PF03932 family protein CutC n=1 Tax=Winogradskyella haliclonae TaxID=2048558 RepID=A0ABQ2BYD3_9FLAO|nr:copper homeostasis protein CutC [Winogradskyella haliclonae]GGI56538.1 copper homeostasis protein CutC [Winogradskyella haliclonae]
MILEVCANSYQSAKNAQDAGAHRIELCQELSVGGITPSYGLIDLVKSKLSIPVFVLVRPRSGDFVYSDDEFNVIKKDIQICKDLGCDGIVSGVLNSDGIIDIERTNELILCSKPLPFTFHRAFDEVVNPAEALEQLIDLGVERVLTSGQKKSAEEGLAILKHLNKVANGRITILAGGGISLGNASKFKGIGLKEIHASASIKINQQDSMFSIQQTVSDITKIKAILDAI